MTSQSEWIILIYKAPFEPTRYRASIWREIKHVGRVYLHNGACTFPTWMTIEPKCSYLANSSLRRYRVLVLHEIHHARTRLIFYAAFPGCPK